MIATNQLIPRGGGTAGTGGEGAGKTMIAQLLSGLFQFLTGSRADALILLAVTALTTPLCQNKFWKISPILGYLFFGLLLGPNGAGVVADPHQMEHIAEFGIILFLFEMGIHLDLKTLWDIRTDVFCVGLTQFASTALVISGFCHLVLHLNFAASLIIGWSLALSSSAFVLQLLKDKKQTDSRYGKSSFGILLLQDLMVVPLLVMTPLLAGSGEGSISDAIFKALVSILIGVAMITTYGQTILSPLLNKSIVAAAGSKEAFTALILASVFGGSFLTEGLGLSNTLGAFLMGMIMAEQAKQHKHDIEQAVGTLQGILVGIFFFTVGFEIDLNLIISHPIRLATIVAAVMALKITLATASCLQFGISPSVAQRIGLVLSQGGEFAFVAFRTARAAGILTKDQTRLLLTTVSLTMACTPALEELGASLQVTLDQRERDRQQKPVKNLQLNTKKKA